MLKQQRILSLKKKQKEYAHIYFEQEIRSILTEE
jgi:hypothetical protein